MLRDLGSIAKIEDLIKMIFTVAVFGQPPKKPLRLENLGTSADILGYLVGMILLFLWARIWLREKRDISGVSRV